MNRRFLAMAGLFILLFVFSLKYFNVASYTDRDMHLMKAVPKDAMLIFQIDGYERTANKISNLKYFDKLKMTKTGEELIYCFSFYDSLFVGKKQLLDAIYKNQFLFSLHRTTENSSDVFFVFDFTEVGKPDIQNLIKQNFPKAISSERDYDDETIFEIKTIDIKYSLAYKNELLILSSNSFLVEKSIEQMKNNSSMLDDENFSALSKSVLKNFDVSVFINDRQLVNSSTSLMNENAAKRLKSLAQSVSWNEFDLKFQDDKICLNGFLVCSSFDSLAGFVKQQFKGKLNNKTSVSFNIRENEFEEFLSSILNDDEKKSIDVSNSFIKIISSLNFEFDNSKGIMETHGTIYVGSIKDSVSQAAWEIKLDSKSISPPLVFMNSETNEQMIVIEDSLQQLYLVNKNGEIIWKKKIDGKIIGGVNAIDFYNDGSCHLAFNTERKIYVMNLSGENDGGFPHTLSFSATNPVTVLTPDANGGFRFLVACANGKIYGFEQSGKPMEGWKPSISVGKIIFPIQWIKKGSKEFFLVQSANGVLKFFSRNGKKAAEDILTNDVFDEPFLFAQNKFSASSKTGKFYQLGFDGKLNTNPNAVLQNLIDASCITDSLHYEIADVKSNEKIQPKKESKMEVIFLSLESGKLSASLFNDTKVFELKLTKPANRRMFLFRNEKIICLVDESNKEILLLDFNGKAIQKISDVATSVNLISNDLLILSSEKNISAYNIH